MGSFPIDEKFGVNPLYGIVVVQGTHTEKHNMHFGDFAKKKLILKGEPTPQFCYGYDHRTVFLKSSI